MAGATKRKAVAESGSNCQTRRMRLRSTPARTRHGEKLQQTPNRPNSFFEHFPIDVRRLVYDHLDLPPFPEAKSSSGLYLSCRQAKLEMDQAEPSRLRDHLLRLRKIGQTAGANLQIPVELETGTLPINTKMDFKITVPDLQDDKLLFDHIRDVVLGLCFLRIGQLHIHFVDDIKARTPAGLKLLASIRARCNNAEAGMIIFTLFSPVSDLTDLTGRERPMRVENLFITWAQSDAGIVRAAEFLAGRKIEIKEGAARGLHAYRFAHEGDFAGARVVVVPRAAVCTVDALQTLCCPSRSRAWEAQYTEATMELSTLEIGEGHMIP
jgi:hypothetical protein